MRNYSFCYLDAQGRTETSKFLPFDTVAAAIDFARVEMTSHAIVEVWHDNTIVEPPSSATSRNPSNPAEAGPHSGSAP